MVTWLNSTQFRILKLLVFLGLLSSLRITGYALSDAVQGSEPFGLASQSTSKLNAPRLRRSEPNDSNSDSRASPANVTSSAPNITTTVSPTTLRPTTSTATSTVKPSVEFLKPIKNVTEPPSLLSSPVPHFDARDITYFLESHPAHSVHDPRAYFTDERTTRSMSILLNELSRLPARLRFAFVARVFNELGRKIASKLNHYASEVAAILRKTPDDLGNKPEVSMLVDVVNNAFESKLDFDPRHDDILPDDNPLTRLIGSDVEKAAVYNSALREISNRFANLIAYFVYEGNRTSLQLPWDKRHLMSSYLCEALHIGCKTLISEMGGSDKYRLNQETVDSAFKILNMTCGVFDKIITNASYVPDLNIKKSFETSPGKTFQDLNQLTDQTGLIGPWNTYLFTNLGSAERVVKLLGSLLSRVPPALKTRWINMYMAQVNLELERALSGFVVMQGMPYNKNSSESYLLNPIHSVTIMPQKLPEPRTDYTSDKNRIPARCYLSGRRWRLLLARGLAGYSQKVEFLDYLADRISVLKRLTVGQSGNEFYRLCMPRLETGLRGWDINGEPISDQLNKFPLKSPIENLDKMNDPFVAGVLLGFNLGFKLAYNEERNATLELEAAGSHNRKSQASEGEKLMAAITYLSRASIRRATTVAAQRAYPVAIREGYLSTLKISFRSGMIIPTEAGSQLASLKCRNYGREAGLQEGRLVATTYLSSNSFGEDAKRSLIELCERFGATAGYEVGEVIGAIVGKKASEEAYMRGIIRGGKVGRAKFHLDEYSAGAELGFNYGMREGKRIASSSSLDPSAPASFRFNKPEFPPAEESNEVDQWEKDLIPPVSKKILDDLHKARNHTLIQGSMKGFYIVKKETKKGFKRQSYTTFAYNLDVFADGFIRNNVAYLSLNGTINNMGLLKGSLIARDIFNDDKV